MLDLELLVEFGEVTLNVYILLLLFNDFLEEVFKF